MQLCDRLKKVETNQTTLLASVQRVEESVDALAATVIGIRGRVSRMSSPSLSPSRLSFSNWDEPPDSAERRASVGAVDVKEEKEGKSVKGVALSWLLQWQALAGLLRAGLPRSQAVALLVPVLALTSYGLQKRLVFR